MRGLKTQDTTTMLGRRQELMDSYCYVCRLIKHTEKLLEDKNEKLCLKVLRTLKEMMSVDVVYIGKVF
jgi:hypothetical protein